MRYVSICSGIEAFSVAVADIEGEPWEPVAFSEIEDFPSKVLAHRWPEVPNLGDFTAIDVSTLGQVDWLVGGTPCQAFSVAGMRQSLADDRGNLTLQYVRLAHELAQKNGLRGFLWENVPGVLNTKDNAFGCFLGAVVGHDGALVPPGGRGWPSAGMVAGPRARLAWRVLDSQHFGVPQRRKRVFVIADFGNGADPAAVLFEPRGQKRRVKTRREAGQEIAGTLVGSSQSGGFRTTDLDNNGAFIVADPAYLGNAEGGAQDLPFLTKSNVGKHVNNQTPLVSVFDPNQITHPDNRSEPTPELSHTLPATAQPPVLFASDISPNLRAGGNFTGGHRPPGSDVDTVETLVVYSLMPQNSGKDFKAREVEVAQPIMATGPGSGNQGGDLVVTAFGSKGAGADVGELSPTLRASGHRASHSNGGAPPAIAFQSSQSGVREGETHATLDANNGARRHNGVVQGQQVRRLTPRECERLQGFPDDHTLIPGLTGWREVGEDESVAELEEMGFTIRRTKSSNKLRVNDPDGPRYKSLGNSFTVNTVRWIMNRVARSLAGVPI